MTDEAAEIARRLTKARRTALMLVTERPQTCAEIGASGTALTLLCVQTPALVWRAWARWGGEIGQKCGEGYEYCLTSRGIAVRAILQSEQSA